MDPFAESYLRLALAAGTHADGIVDAYYGPPEVRRAAEASAATPASLADEAAGLRRQVAEEPDPQRRRWLDRQLLALETICRRLAGEALPYVDEVERCFDAPPRRTDRADYEAVHERLGELLPAGDSLRHRVAERDRRLTVAAARLPSVVEWLVDEIRAACAERFPVPDGEALTFSFVREQPWAAYNWYDGDLRSRIEFNTDLPARAQELIGLVTHEAFPGHHLEHAWKETRLVRQQGRAEATIQLINTPEAYISEGLAEVGGRYVVDRERWQRLFAGICARAQIELAPAEPERQWEISDALRGLRPVGADAALMLHADGLPEPDVVHFLEEVGLRSREQAQKNLQFISHVLWRTYVFCYSGGERLLGAWCAAAGDEAAQRRRFLRLLTEQLTPSEITDEMATAAHDPVANVF